jgi:ketosteroid isomerase-like protein
LTAVSVGPDPVDVVRALWLRMQARDWAGARALLHDDAVLRWWTSGERIEGGDGIVHVNRAYPEGWTIHMLDAAWRHDGRVHALVRVDHPPHRFFANSIATVQAGRIVAIDKYWGTVEEPPAWRHAGSVPGWSRFDPSESSVSSVPSDGPRPMDSSAPEPNT